MIKEGQAGGTLTLTNNKGSMTLELVGPEQPGFSPLPQTFQYKLKSSTGTYQHQHFAGGTLQLLLQSAQGSDHSTFTLIL